MFERAELKEERVYLFQQSSAITRGKFHSTRPGIKKMFGSSGEVEHQVEAVVRGNLFRQNPLDTGVLIVLKAVENGSEVVGHPGTAKNEMMGGFAEEVVGFHLTSAGRE